MNMSKIYYSKEIDMNFLKKNVNRKENFVHYKKICADIIRQERVLVNCPVCKKKNSKRNIFITVYGLEYIQCWHRRQLVL